MLSHIVNTATEIIEKLKNNGVNILDQRASLSFLCLLLKCLLFCFKMLASVCILFNAHFF
jgi:hypothetical protein